MKNSLVIADTLLSRDARPGLWLVRDHEHAHPRGRADTGENDLPQMPRAMRAAPRHRLPLT